MKKELFGIYKKGQSGLYPQTHIFVMPNRQKALYAFVSFAGSLLDSDIELKLLGSIDSDVIIPCETEVICDFTNVVEVSKSYNDTAFSDTDIDSTVITTLYNRILVSIDEHIQRVLGIDLAGKESVVNLDNSVKE
nr:MAG: hypothetical protein [Microvirus Sku113]